MNTPTYSDIYKPRSQYPELRAQNPAPWTQAHDLAVVKDPNGVTVSFQLQAPRIVTDINFANAARPLLERMIAAVKAATGPNANAGDTQKLVQVAVLAEQVLKGE